MTRRKGELTPAKLKRDFPYHVALPAEAVRGIDKAETVRGFAAALGRR